MRKETKLKLLSWGIYLGALGVLILLSWGDKPDPTTVFAFVIWITLIVMALFDVNVPWIIMMSNELNKLMPILTVENNPDGFINEIEKLLGKTKSKRFQRIRHFYLSVGFFAIGDYDEAKRLLLKVDVNKFPEPDRTVYWANLAELHFLLGESEDAMRIMEFHQKEFLENRESKNLGQTIAVLEIFWSLTVGNKEEARALLEQARAKWEDSLNKLEFDELQRRLEN